MKRVLIMLLLVTVLGAGCDSESESDLNTRLYQTSPIGSSETLDVPAVYSTIQEAVNAANTGDFIRVAPGVYPENILIDSKSFALRGAGKGQTIIQGWVQIYNTPKLSFEGFTVQGGGVYVKDALVTITGNEIIDSPGAGLWLENCYNVVISDNDIWNNGGEGILVNTSSGVIGSSNVTQNTTDGIVIVNCSPEIVGNNVTFNGRDGISIGGFNGRAAPQLLENTVQDNGSGSNYDIICFGVETNPTGTGNVFNRCLNCAECRSFDNPVTFQD